MSPKNGDDMHRTHTVPVSCREYGASGATTWPIHVLCTGQVTKRNSGRLKNRPATMYLRQLGRSGKGILQRILHGLLRRHCPPFRPQSSQGVPGKLGTEGFQAALITKVRAKEPGFAA